MANVPRHHKEFRMKQDYELLESRESLHQVRKTEKTNVACRF